MSTTNQTNRTSGEACPSILILNNNVPSLLTLFDNGYNAATGKHSTYMNNVKMSTQMQLLLTCGTKGHLHRPTQWCLRQIPAHWGSLSGTGRSSHNQSPARTQCPERSPAGPAPGRPIQQLLAEYNVINPLRFTTHSMIDLENSQLYSSSAILWRIYTYCVNIYTPQLPYNDN